MRNKSYLILKLCLGLFLIEVCDTLWYSSVHGGNSMFAANAQEVLSEGALLPESDFQAEIWTGDFDGMVQRRVIRVLVSTSPMLYFMDGATKRGATYEGLQLFEEKINKELNTGNLRIRIVYLPLPRDRLLEALQNGWGDIAAANLTITDERLEAVDFSDPLASDVTEIAVTNKALSEMTSKDELSGLQVMVRKSSSYYQSLVALNESFTERDMAPVEIIPASEYLGDADLIEMVNADLIPMVIVDNHKAEFWSKIYDNIRPHEQVAIRQNGQIGWAIRKDSPLLKENINQFVKENKKGTLHGNIILNRYLRDNRWVRNSTSGRDRARFNETIAYFQKFAEQYDFDWLMLAAQGYQESRLDQSAISGAGAIGVMQLLPSTAEDKNVGIPDIHLIEQNIHAGTKYLRFLVNRYFSDGQMDELNRHLFGFAAYNAGPNRVARLRAEARDNGLDPNIWFDNVEVIASRRIGRETVQYVSNIFKYFIAYRLIVNNELRRQDARREGA